MFNKTVNKKIILFGRVSNIGNLHLYITSEFVCGAFYYKHEIHILYLVLQFRLYFLIMSSAIVSQFEK